MGHPVRTHPKHTHPKHTGNPKYMHQSQHLFLDGRGVKQSAVYRLLFLQEPGDGEWIAAVAFGFGYLTSDIALAMLELPTAQGLDGSV